MTRRTDQIDNENEFGLGHWSETNSQYSDVRHMMHAPLTTPTPLNIAATACHGNHSHDDREVASLYL